MARGWWTYAHLQESICVVTVRVVVQALIPHAQTHVATTVEEVAAWPSLIAEFLARLPTATDSE